MLLNVVLYQPDIPQNTGNIARTCAATGTILHLVHPLGFQIDAKHIRRAGLDYWQEVVIREYESWEVFRETYGSKRTFFFTTKGKRLYTEVDYREGDYLVFGPETRGLPEEIIAPAGDRALRIPMRQGLRSLNLSNSVALVLYEALRQLGFKGLE